MSAVELLGTPSGEARVHVDPAAAPVGCLVLGHGAGGGVLAPDLAALATHLPVLGWDVVRVEQPYLVAGRRVAPRAPVLDEAWCAVVEQLHLRGPLVVGGRSSGARVACRTARTTGAAGVVALAFPLQPPPRPGRAGPPAPSRRGELEGAGVPTLAVQGSRDEFGGPDELGEGPYRVVAVPGADHSFRAPAGAGGSRAALALVVAAVSEWLASLAPPAR